MIALIRAASECNDPDLTGKYIAKAELCIKKGPQTAFADIVKKRRNFSVLRAAGEGSELILYLMNRNDVGKDKLNVSEIPPNAVSLVISNKDVKDYLLRSGDTNPIHTGENPVIPGLLILEKILPHENIDVQARFHVPVYAGDTLYISKNEQNMTVLNNERVICLTISVKKR